MECFHRRATEIQALLRSTEPPLELQVQHVIYSVIMFRIWVFQAEIKAA